MAASKTFTIDKIEFQKNFLDPINKFKAGSEFLPFYFINGKIVVFCAHRAKESKATIGLYMEFEPESSTLDEGEVFYVRDPSRMQKSLSLIDSDKVVIRVTSSHIIAEGEKQTSRYRLYDAMLASKDKTFWKPSRFDAIRSLMTEGIKLDKGVVETIQKASSTVSDDLAYIKYDEDTEENHLILGNEDRDSFKLQIPNCDVFSKYSKFSKFIFNVVGRTGVTLSETSNHKMMTLIDKTETTVKYCFVAKFD